MVDLRPQLAELPCGRRLLDAAAGTTGVHLVGGAVRDLLLGRQPRELDVVVEGEIAPLADRLGADVVAHERFGTATLRSGPCRWDLASARAETYAHPGALPEVRPAAIEADLLRRDVTINSFALDLATGELRSAAHAEEDLRAGRLRVLHDASLRDDPTRLWRIARYATRLGFTIEDRTAQLARAAVAGGALETVSMARIGNELRLALAEPDPAGAFAAAAELGLADWLAPDRGLTERALELLPLGEGRPDLLVLAGALRPGACDAGLLAELQFSAAEREVVLAACSAAPLQDDAAARPSRLARELRGHPVEAVALAGARGAAGPARRWLDDLRHVGLLIGGDDLIAAGLAEGPAIGLRLQAILDRRLDGELPAGRAAELAAALAWVPRAGSC
jgi:tRNA nucleotidyltransferase (CCA-adding enzyme)